MKIFPLFLICLLGSISTFAQVKNLPSRPPTQSYWGGVHTPKGHLHILWIFVRYNEVSRMNSRSWPDESELGKLPKMAMGSVNGLLNADTLGLGQPGQPANISDFYYKMSAGKFLLTGDVFPIQVPVDYTPETGRSFFSRYRKMNKAAIRWIADNFPDFPWHKYDKRTNNTRFQGDNSTSPPDSVLDYVVIMYRDKGLSGVGSVGNILLENSPYSIETGHTGIKSYADKEHNWQFFNHEFSHNLFSSPHYMGANRADGGRYYTQKGWGFMDTGNSMFATINAWEAWWLDWLSPQEITRAGTYTLKDYLTERDAIRIPIPDSKDYLWIENHQKKDFWDDKLFFGDTAKKEPQLKPGIYMYIAGSQGATRASGRLNPFSFRDANLFKVLSAEGNFDYRFRGDSIDTEFLRAPVFVRGLPNPIAGQNGLQFIRADFDGDGQIKIGRAHGNNDGGGGEQNDIWVEEIEGKAVYTLRNTGNEKDAFQVGDEVGLSGIVPVLKYPSFNMRKQALSPQELNGLSVSVISQNDSGHIQLQVDFDDWEVRTNQRWCGHIVLSPIDSGAPPTLSIMPNINLVLAQNETPDRINLHPATRTFSNLTRLELGEHRKIQIQKRGTLTINSSTVLMLKDSAELVLEKKAKLIIDPRASLHMGAGSRIYIEKGGNLQLDEGANVYMHPTAEIIWSRKRDRRKIPNN